MADLLQYLDPYERTKQFYGYVGGAIDWFREKTGLWPADDGGNYVPLDRDKVYNHLPFEMQYLMANLPFGFGNMTRVQDEVRYWQDYIKNTGKKPLYPGRVVTSNLENSINSVMDWWI